LLAFSFHVRVRIARTKVTNITERQLRKNKFVLTNLILITK